MTLRADIRIPAEQFALASTFDALPDAVVEVESDVANPFEGIPHLRVVADDGDVTDLLRRDGSTRSVELLREAGSERLYGVEWETSVLEALSLFLRERVSVLTLVGRDGRWRFGVRCCGREALSSLQSALDDAGYGVTLETVRTTDTSGASSSPLLTEKQRAALAVAVREGYYDVPRESTMSRLAEDLDISQQALSKRLRRAHASLATRYLADHGVGVDGRDTGPH